MRLVLTELHAGVQISSKEIASKKNLSYIKLKIRFPSIYASTSLDTKTLGISSNRNFWSCLSIPCLASRHISCIFHFSRGFSFAFGNFAQYCTVLLRPIETKKMCLPWITFATKSWSIVNDVGGPVVPYWVAISGGDIISWHDASCLRVFMG